MSIFKRALRTATAAVHTCIMYIQFIIMCVLSSHRCHVYAYSVQTVAAAKNICSSLS